MGADVERVAVNAAIRFFIVPGVVRGSSAHLFEVVNCIIVANGGIVWRQRSIALLGNLCNSLKRVAGASLHPVSGLSPELTDTSWL